MEVKKTKKADLEKKRGMFFQMGFVMALGAALVAFEWKTSEDLAQKLVCDNGPAIELDLPPISVDKKPEIVVPVPKKISVNEILIVEDNTEIEDDYVIESDVTEDTSVALSEVKLGEEDDGDPIPFVMLECKPEFPGGEKALLSYLSKSVKYPELAQELGIQGSVYLSFVIGKAGEIQDVKILRGVDASLDQEAMRVVSSMPKWKPGRQGDRPVRVSFQVPIKFTLR